MRKKILIIGIICGLLTQSIVAFAADVDAKIKTQLIKKLDEAPVTQCKDYLVPLFDLELKDFLQYLDTTFQNKSSNSSLTNTAIARYQDYKSTLEGLFSRLDINDPKNQDYVTASAAYDLCANLLNVYYSTGKKMMIDHIKQTAATKNTSVLLEKYQAINSKLRDLNTVIAQMFGYFSTFKDIFPGFVEQCLTSG
ncbi:hypothetical protein HZA40_04415 [Candidatus Peregrinibacteria bacterium]|nr:hypothetical protein [Candidatus Peregrinibacteria bacterium]